MPPKKPKFKSGDADWTEDSALFIKDADLAKFVFDAIQVRSDFRLIVDGAITYSRPKVNPPAYAPTTHPLVWSNKDLEWDDAACLVVKDKKLAKLITDAKANAAPFKIEVPLDAVSEAGNGGGIGENKANAMCLC